MGSMSVPVADMVSIGAVMAGTDLTPPRDTLIFTPPPGAVATLQRLHTAAANLAETAPEIIANPNAAHRGRPCYMIIIALTHAESRDRVCVEFHTVMQNAWLGLSVERDDGSAAPPVYVIDLP